MNQPAGIWPVTLWLAASAWFVSTILAASDHGGLAGVAGGLATAAVVLATLVVAARVGTTLALPRHLHRTLGRTLRARVLRAGAMRHSDPDAPGRPRPRAPGAPLLAV